MINLFCSSTFWLISPARPLNLFDAPANKSKFVSISKDKRGGYLLVFRYYHLVFLVSPIIDRLKFNNVCFVCQPQIISYYMTVKFYLTPAMPLVLIIEVIYQTFDEMSLTSKLVGMIPPYDPRMILTVN